MGLSLGLHAPLVLSGLQQRRSTVNCEPITSCKDHLGLLKIKSADSKISIVLLLLPALLLTLKLS